MQYTGGPPVQADLNALATNMVSEWASNLSPYFSTTITLVSAQVLDISSNTGLLGTSNSGLAGNHPAPPVESGTAVHLRFRTLQHYRGGHPGIYLPPGPQDDVVQPSSWTPGFQSQMVGSWNSVILGLQGVATTSIHGLIQVAVQYYKGKLANTDPSPWAPKNVPLLLSAPNVHPVTSIVCTPLIASQRRRRQSTGA